MHRRKIIGSIIGVTVALLGAKLLLWSASGAGTPPADPVWVESIYTVSHWGAGRRHVVDPPPVTTFYKVSSGVQTVAAHTFKGPLSEVKEIGANSMLPGDSVGRFTLVEREGHLNFKFNNQPYDFTKPPADSCWAMSPTYNLQALYVKGSYLIADVQFFDNNFFQGYRHRDNYLVIWKQGHRDFLYRLKIYGQLANVEW